MATRHGTNKRVRRGPISALTFALRLLSRELDSRLYVLVAVALTLVLAASALTALSPVFLKLLVDRLSASGDTNQVWLTIGLLAAGYASSQWLIRTITESRFLAIGRIDQRLHRRLSLRLFEHIMALPLRFHLDRKTGALSQTLTNGLTGYRLVIQHSVQTVLPVLIELALMASVLYVLGEPIFLGIIGATLLCYAIAFTLGAIKLTQPARAVSASHIDANALLTDNILNYEIIKSFCAERRMHRRMEEAFTRTEARWALFFTHKALNGVLVGTIFAFSLGISVYVAARAVQAGRITLGDFVLVNTYMLQIFRPMEMLGMGLRDIAEGMAFIQKMLELFREKPESWPSRPGKPLPRGIGALCFDRVSFAYEYSHPVLRNVSFKIPAGTTVALVGASGSGKSTLIRLLMRFWEPDSGHIFLDGICISELSVANLRQAIAIVPQDIPLFNDTIAYNISVGSTSNSKADIINAARLAHIHDSIVSHPGSYEALVGERGLKLSAGEKQRIAIARAALRRPRIFVFDEATSSLDLRTERKILHSFRQVSRGTTTLVVAHRLSTVVNADQILVLDHGEIIERGTHRNLLKNPGVYRTMWTAQQEHQRMA